MSYLGDIHKKCRKFFETDNCKNQILKLKAYKDSPTSFPPQQQKRYSALLNDFGDVFDDVYNYYTNSNDAYTCCKDWLDGKYSATDKPKDVLNIKDDYIIHNERSCDFYSEKLKQFFDSYHEDIAASVSEKKLPVSYHYGSDYGIGSWIILNKKKGTNWSVAQNKIIEIFKNGFKGYNGKDITEDEINSADTTEIPARLDNILHDSELGEPVTQATKDKIIKNLDNYKEQLIDFERNL